LVGGPHGPQTMSWDGVMPEKNDMKGTRSVWGPPVVLAVALITGGWFLQRGVDQEANVYLQARLFQEVLDHVTDQYVDPVDRSGLVGAAIEGVLGELNDPHTSFIDAETWEGFRFQSGADADYGGVGLEILNRDGWVTVITPIPGGPALRAGIRAGDRVIEVEGVSAADWETDQAAGLLRGAPGTDVNLLVDRPGVDEPIPFKLTRAVIELLSVPFATMLKEGVGYVPLQVFSETSASEVRGAIEHLQEDGLTSLILDLRGNPGGLLDEGVGVADLFLNNGSPILETRGRAPGQNQNFAAVSPELVPGVPVVLLVNESSASASEIVAGALQDHDRALVIGNRTYGKGSVQTLFPLSGGSRLRLTTARWYTPVGRSIQIAHDEQAEGEEGRSVALGLGGQPVLTDTPEEGPSVESFGGRVLYGGGGITPDLVALPDTLLEPEQVAVQRLFRSAGVFALAVFNHAVSYVQDHPDLNAGFVLPASELDGFYRTLVDEHEVVLDESDFDAAQRFVRYQLENQIALQAWGEAGAFEHTRGDDAQLNTAIEILSRADSPEALFDLADDARAIQPATDVGAPSSTVPDRN
jgi:carboxyl-terminal processing protease